MDDSERYKGHLNLCEIDLPGQRALASARVLIAGAGGLGSPVALYLAAAGVGTIGIADADIVSLSNLQRQIMHGTPDVGSPKTKSARRAMERINPAVRVVEHCMMIDAGNITELLDGYDVVADCTDNFATRLLLSDTCARIGRPLAYAAVDRFSGQIFTQLPGHRTLRDIFGSELRADAADCVCARRGILNAAVGVAGSLQAAEVIKIITGAGDPLVDRLLTFDLITMDLNVFDL